MRCIIVEDEPLALERLKDYVQRLPLLELVATFDSATEALSFLLAQPVDLVLLDISLGGMSGIELLETAAISGQVVLTTAHPDHALKAFDLKVADYLLKPFTFARFVQGIERAQSRHTSTPPPVNLSYLFVKVEFRLEKVRIADILYIAGDSDYRKIHTLNGQLSTLQTLREFEQR
jgi:two-component system, LytTR family, response regulator